MGPTEPPPPPKLCRAFEPNNISVNTRSPPGRFPKRCPPPARGAPAASMIYLDFVATMPARKASSGPSPRAACMSASNRTISSDHRVGGGLQALAARPAGEREFPPPASPPIEGAAARLSEANRAGMSLRVYGDLGEVER